MSEFYLEDGVVRATLREGQDVVMLDGDCGVIITMKPDPGGDGVRPQCMHRVNESNQVLGLLVAHLLAARKLLDNAGMGDTDIVQDTVDMYHMMRAHSDEGVTSSFIVPTSDSDSGGRIP